MGKRKRKSQTNVINTLYSEESKIDSCLRNQKRKEKLIGLRINNLNFKKKRPSFNASHIKTFNSANSFKPDVKINEIRDIKNSIYENEVPNNVLKENNNVMKNQKHEKNGYRTNNRNFKSRRPSFNTKTHNSNSFKKFKPDIEGNEIREDKNRISQYEVPNILTQRQSLPIYDTRTQIISELRKSETSIIISETGSGKTTQIPQFIYEENLARNKTICITQPRRIAAITIAKRVADEIGCNCGEIVGFSVRFEDCTSEKTKIKYVTDGMLLREALLDPLLKKYSWIILDEAHERSINTDILFGVVKEAQKIRKIKNKNLLNIIVMSATMDVDHFSDYFNEAPVLYVEGRQHPVELYGVKTTQYDYFIACLRAMLKIHKIADSSDDGILIFLTGQEEIDWAVKVINFISKDKRISHLPTLKAYPLYAALPHHKQLKIFNPSTNRERRVIVSTNIAETSVTIPGIKYVVDSGRAKMRTYNSTSGFEELKVCIISQSQARQRAGRAGRLSAGFCYRVYTDEEYDQMKVDTVPEILTTNLTSVILKLLAVGIKNVVKFDYIDKPPIESIREAKKELKDLKAYKVVDGKCVLTDIGKKLSYFPLEPNYAKLILNSAAYSCSEEMLTLVAILSSESVLVNPTDKREEANDQRKKFSSGNGDHLTLLNVYDAFMKSTNKKKYCRKNFLNLRNLNYASDVRRQLKEICERNQIHFISCGGKTDQVLKCLISVLYKKCSELNGTKYKVLKSGETGRIHPSSTMFGHQSDYVLYTNLVRTEHIYMHTCSSVKVEWLLEQQKEYFRGKIRDQYFR